ncbi:TIGR03915 family putative DNA repair protein [Pedobacter sp. MC2016-14]|uniref:TIGR03915 family putative DNA repair protein n=1 Tax=Pedobacter sp. MC2016-14 TaxID=2897327 RepID=UPI001E4541C1|nr:TIGR03915 family putative DNA repair protein [Pedobacter sp. MC2016-14]MCD0487050.1 TIGR03915 family putative DNA repair protein [Pedobacter sp. MC2016-14]
MVIYRIDGSLEGILCAVFEWFERKPGKIKLIDKKNYQPDAFSDTLEIFNDTKKADRVWKGLQKKLDKIWLRRCYCCFLSEQNEALNNLFEFICYVFSSPEGSTSNYGNTYVLAVAKMARKVEREKHRMEAFIRFQHSADGIFYCGIEPDFNVLPLILNHFQKRYADQRWIIYDLKRHYGLYYNLDLVEEIRMEISEERNLNKPSANRDSEKESLYSILWKDYFKSTNITSRKNTKLHLQHVPKRYWKYLTEKQLGS